MFEVVSAGGLLETVSEKEGGRIGEIPYDISKR